MWAGHIKPMSAFCPFVLQAVLAEGIHYYRYRPTTTVTTSDRNQKQTKKAHKLSFGVLIQSSTSKVCAD
jgi:hypothetical protein